VAHVDFAMPCIWLFKVVFGLPVKRRRLMRSFHGIEDYENFTRRNEKKENPSE
jgi:hypothetical protein